jgi:hypothetical protein
MIPFCCGVLAQSTDALCHVPCNTYQILLRYILHLSQNGELQAYDHFDFQQEF